MILFYYFHWHDLGLLSKILSFLGLLGKINYQELGKKSKKSKILATNEKIRDVGKKFKIIQDFSKKIKTPSTGKILQPMQQKLEMVIFCQL